MSLPIFPVVIYSSVSEHISRVAYKDAISIFESKKKGSFIRVDALATQNLAQFKVLSSGKGPGLPGNFPDSEQLENT